MRRSLFVLPLFLSICVSVPLSAQVAADTTARISPLREEVTLVRSSLARGLTAPRRWTFDTARDLAGASALVIALSSQDEAGRALMGRNQSEFLDGAASVIQPLGMEASFPIIGAFLITGLAFDQPRARTVGAEALASSMVSGSVTAAVKFAFGRSRPRDDEEPYTFRPLTGAQSFPSGHTTQAFAIASVIASEYDATWVKVSAYGLATLVGTARMYSGAHYVSDVVAGALIGTSVGRMIVGGAAGGRAVSVQPAILSDGRAGIQVRLTLPQSNAATMEGMQ